MTNDIDMEIKLKIRRSGDGWSVSGICGAEGADAFGVYNSIGLLARDLPDIVAKLFHKGAVAEIERARERASSDRALHEAIKSNPKREND